MYLYKATAGLEIGRVSKYGIVLSSISSRMRAVAFTRVTKIRTTEKKSGIMRTWKRMISNAATRATARESARMNGIDESSAMAMTRRVPSRYPTVRPATTQNFRPDSERSTNHPTR
jgi:hypothetical protein